MTWLTVTLLVLILIGQAYLVKKVRRIMAEIDDLESIVAAESTVIASSNALMTEIKRELDAALATGNDADLKARIVALSAKIGADKDSISAAVVANTPVVPGPSAPPAPPPFPIDPTTGVTVIPLTADQIAAGQAPTPAQSAAFPPDGATIPTDLQRIAAKHLASGTLPIDPTTGKQVVPLTRPQLDAGLAPTETQLAMFPPDGGTVKP